jgi:hypothetical protein
MVDGNCRTESWDTLKIEPAIMILFSGHDPWNVSGILLAQDEAAVPIIYAHCVSFQRVGALFPCPESHGQAARFC